MCNLIKHSLALLNVKKLSENSKFSAFDWSNILLDQLKNGEIHHKGSTLFD